MTSLETWLHAEIAVIEADERFHYKPADVFVNAPLALIQVEMTARVSALKQVLARLPPDTKVPHKADDQRRGYRERGTCQRCGRNVSLRVPKGGDGSVLVAAFHHAQEATDPMGMNFRCAGVGQEVPHT